MGNGLLIMAGQPLILAPQSSTRRRGIALAMVVIAVTILTTLGIGLLAIGYGRAARGDLRKGRSWQLRWPRRPDMRRRSSGGQQQDMLALQLGSPGTSGSLTFPDSSCTYAISLYTFVSARPVFRGLRRPQRHLQPDAWTC